jgi:hypothetical protein
MKLRLIPCALALLLVPILTLADDKITYPELLSQVTAAQPICFGREFPQAFLDAHPAQIVKSIRVKIVKDPTFDPNYNYLEINATLKGDQNFFKLYKAYLICGQDGECVADGDNGHVKAYGFRDGSLGLLNEGFTLDSELGARVSNTAVALKPTRGADDLFHLDRLPNSFCQL